MLDSFFHMTLKLLKKSIFGMKTSRFCDLLCNVTMYIIMLRYQICKPSVVYRFNCMTLYHSQT